MYSQYFIILQDHGEGSKFWGAFWGAFLAFIFGLIAYRITKRWERFILHKNSLAKMERVLNSNLNELSLAESITKDALSNLRETKLTPDRVPKMDVPENVDMEFGSLRILNDFMNYKSTIIRFNHNVSSLNHVLNRFDEMLLTNPDLIGKNIPYAINMLAGFEREIPKVVETFKDYLVVIRINLAKVKSNESFLYGVINSIWEFEITDQELKQERSKFESEVRMLGENSKKE